MPLFSLALYSPRHGTVPAERPRTIMSYARRAIIQTGSLSLKSGPDAVRH